MKSYTDLEQSKRLTEILPIESADMCYLSEESLVPKVIYNGMVFFNSEEERLTNVIYCWSIAALLGVLPRIDIEKEICSDDTFDYRVKAYIGDGYIGNWFDSPLDACVDMIIKLDEQKLL